MGKEYSILVRLDLEQFVDMAIFVVPSSPLERRKFGIGLLVVPHIVGHPNLGTGKRIRLGLQDKVAHQ